MENLAYPEKDLPKISPTSGDIIQTLIKKIIEESEKLLHPDKH
ncbi:hypothetical protein [Pedobacter sp. B4-66]|nr:hypothetical protein [Pedobacter sp. B4-66]